MDLALTRLLLTRSRACAAVAGSGALVLLVLVLGGACTGATRPEGSSAGQPRETVRVMHAEASAGLATAPTLPDAVAQQVARVVGVAPVLAVPSELRRGDRESTCQLVGAEPEDADLAGPRDLAAARRLLDLPDRVSYLVVAPVPGLAAQTLADRVRAEVPGVTAMTAAELTAPARRAARSTVGPAVQAVVASLLVAGIVLVALTVGSLSTSQCRDVAVLKAIGVPDRTLYRHGVMQAVVLVVAGSAGGGVLASVAEHASEELPGGIDVAMTPTLWAGALAVTVFTAVLGSLVAVRRIRAIDAREAFRP